MDIGAILELQAREIQKLRGDVDALKRQETPIVSLENAFLAAQDGRIEAAEDQLAAGQFSGARVYNATAVTIPDSTFTNLTFDSVRYDNQDYYNGASPTRLTVPVSGYYSIFGHLRFAASATGTRIVRLLVNGSITVAQQRVTSLGFSVIEFSIATEYQLSAGQYVTLSCWQNSGGDLDVAAESDFSPVLGISKLPL